MRELKQAVRRILLTGRYAGSAPSKTPELHTELMAGIEAGSLDADAVLAAYCALLYEKSGSLEAVARLTNLDWRTVKKYTQMRPHPGRSR